MSETNTIETNTTDGSRGLTLVRQAKKQKQIISAEKKKQYNETTYKNRLWVIKMRHIFTAHPYVQEKHTDEIKQYIQDHGAVVDEPFIEFLKTFVVHQKCGAKKRAEDEPPKKRAFVERKKRQPSNKLPKEMNMFLSSENS